jgi:predicted nucleic acid-binding protein
MIVLDASVALAWLLGETVTDPFVELFDVVNRDGALVPGNWWLELSNGLLMALRRGRISEAIHAGSLLDASLFNVMADSRRPDEGWRSVSDLARVQGLTTYDAAYIELASRHDFAIATLDDKMRAAAMRLGITVV